ncbi:MAG: tRNA pseudouridine(55) synthase TruB [Spirochaetes bacterium]|nr:tRNA pseudouridine(55) synthase TruB [Spirochaetota bacterium]
MIHNTSGIINLYKPTGLTCAQLVNDTFKKKFNFKKVGYSGTLDKFAEGVLPILLNKATKISKFLEANDKEYIADIQLGIQTDTLDYTGEVVKENKKFKVEQSSLLKAVNSFIGEIKQTPPKFSAIKIEGKRASDLTREGQDVKLSPRMIKIYNIDLMNIDYDKNIFVIKVKCSKGTFIRALARDIGIKLNAGAMVTKLVRTRNGLFTVEDAIQRDDIESVGDLSDLRIYSIDEVLQYYPELIIKSKYKNFVLNGKKINRFYFLDFGDNLVEGIFKIKDTNNKLLAIVEYKREKFYYLKVFAHDN